MDRIQQQKSRQKTLPGSVTVEAAIVYPLVLAALAMVIGLGMDLTARTLQQIEQVQEASDENLNRMPERLRGGQAFYDWLEELTP